MITTDVNQVGSCIARRNGLDILSAIVNLHNFIPLCNDCYVVIVMVNFINDMVVITSHTVGTASFDVDFNRGFLADNDTNFISTCSSLFSQVFRSPTTNPI